MKTRIKITIVGAITILVIGFFIIQKFSQSPRSVFKRLVIKPIPASVQSIEESHFLAMDSTFWALHFRIGKTDLQTILNAQLFTPINESEELKRWDQNSKDYVKIQKEEYLNGWKRHIHDSAKLDVDITTTWQVFTLNEGGGTKYFSSIQIVLKLSLLLKPIKNV